MAKLMEKMQTFITVTERIPLAVSMFCNEFMHLTYSIVVLSLSYNFHFTILSLTGLSTDFPKPLWGNTTEYRLRALNIQKSYLRSRCACKKNYMLQVLKLS